MGPGNLSVAEMQALDAIARELPRISKALERIATAMESKETTTAQ